MPYVRFELAIPVFERAKTFRSLDRTATVIGILIYEVLYSLSCDYGAYYILECGAM
jgi:hypothetical protein